MILDALTFPIDLGSFTAFLVNGIPNADGIVTTATGYEVVEKNPFTQTDIDTINTHYNGLTQAGEAAKLTLTTTQIVANTIAQAMQFSNALMLQFAAENVLLGVTQAGKSGAILEYLHDLIHSFLSGSLYEAITQIDGYIADTSDEKTSLSAFINNTRLQLYKNKIQTYLGIPLT